MRRYGERGSNCFLELAAHVRGSSRGSGAAMRRQNNTQEVMGPEGGAGNAATSRRALFMDGVTGPLLSGIAE